MNINRLKADLRVRLTYLSKMTEWCSNQLKKCPDGNLRIKRQGNSVSYYRVNDRTGNNGVLLDKKNGSTTRKLAQKRYLQKLLSAASSEGKAIERILARYEHPVAEDIFDSLSEDRKVLITPVTLPDKEFLEKWQSRPYVRKALPDNLPVYKTLKGDHVRSKSEQIIADRLYVNGIPYKYECPLSFGDFNMHPDFTIMRMSDRREIYYEHFGKMDDPGYASDNVRRLRTYELNGYLLGDNLFASFETSLNPLDTRILDEMIRVHFK